MSLALPDHLRYIAVEGVIGAGKTTLARMLADQVDARLVLEEFEENPFLSSFYEDQERWALRSNRRTRARNANCDSFSAMPPEEQRDY